MAQPAISPETLERLGKFDTPTICNVIELFDVCPRNAGFMNGSIQCNFPELPPMVGFALTSTFRSMAAPRGSDAYGSLTSQVERFADLPGPAVVVFQDLDQPCVAATFGEVMCSVYQGFGAKGIITSGGGRDLDQVQAIKFPAFTGGTICSHAYCHILQVGGAVTVGGICIETGMLLHGDRNGVTTVPIDIASEIPDACVELAKAEQIVIDYVRGKNPTPAGLTEARKACAADFEKLAKRLRRK